jgi:beta-lactamase regulating signal transducer with metallopeptidase domain
MSTLLEIAVSNVVMAAVLAVPAMLAGLWGRRPALTHGLWLLVLIKLLTPPVFEIPLPWPVEQESAAGQPVPMAPPLAALREAPPSEPVTPRADGWEDALDDVLTQQQPDPITVEAPLAVPVQAPAEPELPPAPVVAPAASESSSATWISWLALPWLAGSLAWLILAGRRLNRFRRLLRFARPAPIEVQAEARALANALQVPCPQVLLLPGAISPMLWVAGKSPRLVLPEGLLGRLGPGQLATVLAHELAHWRRGDHRLRWLEMAALMLYWWCPLAWWARRELHQAEEECCDAWVIELLPDSARAYALALVETIDYLSGAPAALPFAASGVGHVRLLKRRLTMILRGSTPRSLTRTGLACVAGLGLLLLPFVPGLGQSPANKTPPRGQADVEALQAILHKLQEEAAAQVDKRAADEALAALERAQAELRQHVLRQQDVERVQQDLQAKRKALEQRLQDIQQAINQLRAQEEKGPGDRAWVDPAGKALGQRLWAGQAGKPASIEQRLEAVERKLDALLWEVTSLRRDMGKQPGGFPPGMPGAPKNFIPGPGGPRGDRGPGGADDFRGGPVPGGPGSTPGGPPRGGFPGGGDARPSGPGIPTGSSPLPGGPSLGPAGGTEPIGPRGGDTAPTGTSPAKRL